MDCSFRVAEFSKNLGSVLPERGRGARETVLPFEELDGGGHLQDAGSRLLEETTMFDLGILDHIGDLVDGC